MHFRIGAALASVLRRIRSAPAGGVRSAAPSRASRSFREPGRSKRTRARAARSSGSSERLMRLKGRHWVLVWIGVFLLTAAAIIGRQTSAFAAARRLRELREQRTALEAQRADLERRIRESSGRRVLEARAERE